jgi:CPA1 family monovalent cation:H+ antiporter
MPSTAVSHTILIVVMLFSIIAAVGITANRLKVPPAILLVLTGVVLALVPGLPTVQLAPELVLLLVLPPIVYVSAVQMSWREFRLNLRPIALMAVGCVAFTTVAAAAATHWLLGIPWAVGFVLGAIVSPPDAVAPLSIARRMQIPRRLLVILEGEGLANDAPALILYRFAVAAVVAGTFSLEKAAGTFAAIVVGELLWGMAVGWMLLRLRRWVNDPQIEILLSILTPFLAYWPPYFLGGSGVLATVVCGLHVSWNGPRLISAATRLQVVFFWDVMLYLIEGILFLLTGLQARALMSGTHNYPPSLLVASAAVVCLAVIMTRFIWMYPATYLPRWLFPAIARSDPSPPWQRPFLIAFTGVRGIDSLAAALAIPFVTSTGAAFPDRELIILLTFAVILVTLVGQGLLLPTVLRALGLAHAGKHERQADMEEEANARRRAIEAAISRLEGMAAEHALPDQLVASLRAKYQARLSHSLRGLETAQAPSKRAEEIDLLLIAAERELINSLHREGKLKDEARRHIELELDLLTAALSNHRG